jgi:hypothetical protein
MDADVDTLATALYVRTGIYRERAHPINEVISTRMA